MTDIVGYQPGDGWLVSGPAAMVMTAGDVDAARRYWALVRRAAAAGEIFGATEPGAAAGDLALLVWEGARVRVLVRGAAAVRATGPAGAVRMITADGLLTWREELLDGPGKVEVGLMASDLPTPAPDEVDLLPVPSGVVRATYASRRASSPQSSDGRVPDRDELPEDAGAASAATGEPAVGTVAGVVSAQAQVPTAAPPVGAALVAEAPAAPVAVVPAPAPAGEPDNPPAGEPENPPARKPENPPAGEPDSPAERAGAEPVGGSPAEADPTVDEPDEITGDDAVTVISMVPVSGRPIPNPVAGVAVPLPLESPPGRVDGDPQPVDASAGPTGESSAVALDAAEPEARHRTPDVTQAVPLDYDEDASRLPGAGGEEHGPGEWHGAGDEAGGGAAMAADRDPDDGGERHYDPIPTAAPEPTTLAPRLLPGPPPSAPANGSGPVLVGPVLGDHDGITELAENLPADFTPPPMPPPLAAGWVYASVCPQGHANQPHAGNCRVCGQPLPPGDPVVAPQPLLGRLRFSTGELVDLDRRVIIGRAPSVSRVSSSELPRLVTVPSPQQDISRSHVEVRLEDWHLVVADLHSTNGTVLRAPDRPEQLLHPGQEMVIEPGWTVDLGDGVTVAVEAAG